MSTSFVQRTEKFTVSANLAAIAALLASLAIFDLHLPSEARWLGLCLVVVLAVIETKVALLLMPAAGEPDFMVALSDPWVALPAQAVALVLVVDWAFRAMLLVPLPQGHVLPRLPW